MSFGSPMDYFNMGLAGGKARSKVSAIGEAIRGILDDSRKRGIVQTQSAGNLQTALGTAAYKNALEKENMAGVGQIPTPHFQKDPVSGKTGIMNYFYDKNSGQIVAKLTPATYNFQESIFEGGGGASDGAVNGAGFVGGANSDLNAQISELLKMVNQ